ncbi:MAG TPA: type II secretion system protein [Kiritimatiellia bacterium]|nr:type II secretion system protein [Kiritimatiellia bacterium]HMP33745.1 type II secretion system protein [Kiritimatiellia bacterium]
MPSLLHDPHHARRGFTLVEIFLVLVVLGILASYVVIGNARTGAALVAEADILRAHLRFVQSLATSNNTGTWTVTFTATGYAVRFDGNPAPVNLPDQNAPNRSFEGGVTLSAGLGTVTFDAFGAPAATYTLVLSDGERTETITITGATGLIP